MRDASQSNRNNSKNIYRRHRKHFRLNSVVPVYYFRFAHQIINKLIKTHIDDAKLLILKQLIFFI